MVQSIALRLTTARLTGYAMTLAVGMWMPAAYFLFAPGNPFEAGNGLAGDFRFFYVLAVMAHRGELVNLYNKTAILDLGTTLMPHLSGGFAYPSAYPPLVALALAPLGALSYTWALVVWTMLTAGLYTASCYAVWRACPRLAGEGAAVATCAIAYPAFFLLIVFGQSSAPALILLSAAYLALKSERPWLAGMAIGAVAYKPQLGMGIAIVMIGSREWRIVGGAVLSGALGLAFTWWQVGTDVMHNYRATLFDVNGLLGDLEPKLYHLHSLRGFFSLLLPWPALSLVAYFCASACLVFIAIRNWRSNAPLPVRFSVLLLTTILVDPHLNVYDLVILAPVFLILANWILEAPRHSADERTVLLIVASFVLPLIGPLSAITHVQLSVVAFCWLSLSLARTNA